MLLRVEPHGLFLWLFLDFLRVTQRHGLFLWLFLDFLRVTQRV